MLVQFKHILLTAVILVISGSSAGMAQSIIGDPADLNFEVINATTGLPGTIERLTLQYSSAHLTEILDIEPNGSNFEVQAVPVQIIGKYVLTAWSGGVPYYRNLRGRILLESPVIIQVFDTRAGTDDIAIVGLNLLARKTDSLLHLEYMLQVHNSAQPPVSMIGAPHLMFHLPEGVENPTLIYGKGPDPLELKLKELSGGMFALQVPLTIGNNKMRIETTLNWREGLRIPIGSNVPIEAWSLMATPENLDIQAFDLVSVDEPEMPGYLRLKGPFVPAGESFSFRISSGKGGGAEENVFTQTENETEDPQPHSTETEKEKDKGFPFVVLTPIFVVILVIIVSRRRQS